MRITPARLFGFLAIFIVWLNLTNLYLLISGLTKISFRTIGILSILILAAYTFGHFKQLQLFMRRQPIPLFLLLFVVIPIASSVIAPQLQINLVGYLILCAFIFLTVMVWIKNEGWERFSFVLFSAWLVGVIGIILSYFMPEMFKNIAMMQEMTGNSSGSWRSVRIAQANLGRAFGFYMQSNRACFAIIMMLILLLPLYFHDKPLKRMLILGISFFAILLTGSRGGFVGILLLSSLLFLSEMLNGIRNKKRIQSGFILLPRYIILGIFAIVGLIVALQLQSTSQSSKFELSATERILESFSSDGDLVSDKSVGGRLQAQKIYLSRIMRSPLYGYGLGGGTYAIATGQLQLASHNNILETAHSYGIPLAIAIYGFLFYLTRTQQAKMMQGYFRYNITLIFFVCIAILSFTSHTLFDFRIFPVLMAFLLMMLYFPVSSKSLQPGIPQHPRNRIPPLPAQRIR